MKEKKPFKIAQSGDGRPLPAVYSRPAVLFFLAVGIICLAEVLVMLLLSRLPELDPLLEALLDAFLLSLFIIPAMVLFVYRPLKENIGQRHAAEFEQRQMQELDRVKNQFISTAAHELSTPLTAVIGYTELLLSAADIDASERRQYLQTILNKGVVLERLTNDLFDLSRIDSGQVVRITKREQPLLPIVESVVHFFQYSMPDRAIEMTVPSELAPLSLDAVRIGQLLENLVSNAFKYSSADAVVRLSIEADDAEVRILVSDQGIGMTAAQVDRVFEKFYRVDRSDTATDGLGLGMTIVKEIVDGHGGRVWVDSRFGHGTTVTVALPRS